MTVGFWQKMARILILVVLLVLGYLGVYWLIRPQLAARYRPPPPPTVHLRVLVNGKPLTSDSASITPNDAVEAYVDIDWHNASPGTVSLTWGGHTIDQGEVCHASNLGVVGLTATASTIATRYVPSLVRLESVSFDVNTYSRLDATAHIKTIEIGDRGPTDIRTVIVRLTSDNFDIENIWLSHASLWFQSGHTDLDRVPVATTEHAGTPPGYIAEFADGAWTLQFERAPEAPLLEQWPTEIMIYGSGWRDNETIDFVALAPFPIQTEKTP